MSVAIRPSFSVDLACPSKVLLARLFARFEEGPYQLRRTRAFGSENASQIRAHDHFILTVAEPQQHFWSPWLNVEVSPREGGAHLFARFSPHPSVWTLFAFTYLGMTTVLLLTLCFSGALVMSGSSPWTLWISGAAALVIVGMWIASQVGQRLAHAQMEELRTALEGAIEACSEAPAAAPALAIDHAALA